MQNEKFSGPVALKVILVKDNKALICKDTNTPDMWELPGGRLHIGETLEECVRREMREELGVEIVMGKLVYSEQFQHLHQSLHLLLAYEVFLENPEAHFAPDANEVAQVKWVSREELGEQKIYGNCLNALKAYL